MSFKKNSYLVPVPHLVPHSIQNVSARSLHLISRCPAGHGIQICSIRASVPVGVATPVPGWAQGEISEKFIKKNVSGYKTTLF